MHVHSHQGSCKTTSVDTVEYLSLMVGVMGMSVTVQYSAIYDTGGSAPITAYSRNFR